MSGFKKGQGIGHVHAGRKAKPPHLGGQGVGNIVAVEIGRGNDAVHGRAGENLLEHVVGDAVADDQFARMILGFFLAHPFSGVFFRCQLIAPELKGAFGELHDVALVHEGDAVLAVGQSVINGFADEALGAEGAHGLDAETGIWTHVGLELVAQKGFQLAGLGAAGRELNAFVKVFGIFTENDHVHQLRVLDRGADAWKIFNGPHAGVEIENLAQGHVEAADASAHRGGHGAFDGQFRAAQGGEGGFGQIFAGFGIGLFTGHELFPVNAVFAVVGFTQRGIQHGLCGGPDFRANAVAFDKVDCLAHACS